MVWTSETIGTLNEAQSRINEIVGCEVWKASQIWVKRTPGTFSSALSALSDREEICYSVLEITNQTTGGIMRIAIGLPSRVASASGAVMLEWITRAERGPFSSVVVTDRVVS